MTRRAARRRAERAAGSRGTDRASCVAATSVRPSPSIDATVGAPSSSRAASGSSAMTSSGSVHSARAMATRCRIPCEYDETGRRSSGSRPSCARTSRPRAGAPRRRRAVPRSGGSPTPSCAGRAPARATITPIPPPNTRVGRRAAEHARRPARRSQQAREHAQQRRLARAVRSGDRHVLAGSTTRSSDGEDARVAEATFERPDLDRAHATASRDRLAGVRGSSAGRRLGASASDAAAARCRDRDERARTRCDAPMRRGSTRSRDVTRASIVVAALQVASRLIGRTCVASSRGPMRTSPSVTQRVLAQRELAADEQLVASGGRAASRASRRRSRLRHLDDVGVGQVVSSGKDGALDVISPSRARGSAGRDLSPSWIAVAPGNSGSAGRRRTHGRRR